MSQPPLRQQPVPLLIAAVGSAIAAGGLAVMAALSVTSNHGALSSGIAAVLVVWACIVGAAAWGLVRGRRWARGPVVAAGLLHLASFAGFIASQPLAIVPTALAAVTVYAALRPETTKALGLGQDE